MLKYYLFYLLKSFVEIVSSLMRLSACSRVCFGSGSPCTEGDGTCSLYRSSCGTDRSSKEGKSARQSKMALHALAVLYYVCTVTELFTDPVLMKFLCVLAVSARTLPAERILRLKQMKPLLISSSALRLTRLRWSTSLLSLYRLFAELTQIHLR
jgi:hypothetical protein